MRRFMSIPLAVVLTLGLVAAGFAAGLIELRAPAASASAGEPDVKRDFMFQINGYVTDNQGGQVLNMFFHYRYNSGIATADIPNYEDLRNDALTFMGAVDASANPYWETLNEELCMQLHAGYPVEAISCQLQVYPNFSAGLPYEPGFHGSIHTIGDIDPLAIPGPIGYGGT